MKRIKLLFNTSRPISWVNTAYPFAAAYLVLGGSLDFRFVISTLFFLIPYNLLMYGVNDVFDYESDIRNPRKGGIEGAITPKKYHKLILIASFALTAPFIIGLMIGASLLSNVTLILVMFFVVAYSLKGLRFKEIPVLDSITSSIHFVGPLLYAYTFFPVTGVHYAIAAAFFLWGVASQAFGAVQDVLPDKQVGIKSIATVFGARVTVYFTAIVYLAASLVIASIGNIYAIIVALVGLSYFVNASLYLGVNNKTSQKTGAGWKRFMLMNYIAGAIITVCLIASAITG